MLWHREQNGGCGLRILRGRLSRLMVWAAELEKTHNRQLQCFNGLTILVRLSSPAFSIIIFFSFRPQDGRMKGYVPKRLKGIV